MDVYPDISISQTLKENEYGKKTLHNPLSLYKGATISEYNVANFSFTVPVRNSIDLLLVSDSFKADYYSGNLSSIDIYIKLSNTFYKLTTAVFESLVYNIEPTSILTISISGTAAKLDRIDSLPTTPEASIADPYVIIRGTEVKVNNQVLDSIAAINLEINNDVNWIPNNTVYDAVHGTTSYRTKYALSGRRISGSITQFLTNNNKTLGADYSTSQSISIKLFTDVNTQPFLLFNLAETVYTRRLSLEELVTRVYDFRLTSSNIAIIPNVK